MKKQTAFKLLAFIFSGVLLFAIGEITLRIRDAAKETSPPPPFDTRTIEEEIGWVITPNYSYSGQMADEQKVNYPLSISFNENGFRAFDKDTPKPNVFFLGDSYTQSVEVSDHRTFYRHLKDSLAFDLYAYGAAGYGTYQQYLILKRYIEWVQPDVVVLQLCANDFIDNHIGLEETAHYGVRKRRPYLQPNGEVVYHEVVTLKDQHKSISKLVNFVQDVVNSEATYTSSEELIAKQSRSYPKFDEAVNATILSLQKIKLLLPEDCAIMAFVSDHYSPQTETFENICNQVGIPMISNIGRYIKDVRQTGKIVHSFDGYHWNEKGHAIVAQQLLLPLKHKLTRDTIPLQ